GLNHKVQATRTQLQNNQAALRETEEQLSRASEFPVLNEPETQDRVDSSKATTPEVANTDWKLAASGPDKTKTPLRSTAPLTLIDEYVQVRTTPDNDRPNAIEQFEHRYPVTRLSLINQDEVRTDSIIMPEFREHGRGYFMAVEENGAWRCFPWFSFDLSD